MAEETPKTTTTEPTTTEPAKETPTEHQPGSTSDLMTSARTLAEAAQAAATKQTDKIDKAKVAGAAEELIGAARTQGHLDSTPAGQYLDKAEDYLHKIHTSESTTTTATPAADKDDKDKSSGSNPVGGIMNMAKGFFK